MICNIKSECTWDVEGHGHSPKGNSQIWLKYPSLATSPTGGFWSNQVRLEFWSVWQTVVTYWYYNVHLVNAITKIKKLWWLQCVESLVGSEVKHSLRACMHVVPTSTLLLCLWFYTVQSWVYARLEIKRPENTGDATVTLKQTNCNFTKLLSLTISSSRQ